MFKEIFKQKKFGWKEAVLCAVLALLTLAFVIVLTSNTAKVIFNSAGGNFDASEKAEIRAYNYYEVAETESNINKYHELLTKKYKISSIASLPEVERDGFRFEGWFYAQIAEDGSIVYTDTEFPESSVKSLTKDSETTVYAKWSPIEKDKTVSVKDNVLAGLDIMWKGMVGIFLVIGIIYLCILGLNRATRSKKLN